MEGSLQISNVLNAPLELQLILKHCQEQKTISSILRRQRFCASQNVIGSGNRVVAIVSWPITRPWPSSNALRDRRHRQCLAPKKIQVKQVTNPLQTLTYKKHSTNIQYTITMSHENTETKTSGFMLLDSTVRQLTSGFSFLAFYCLNICEYVCD